MSNDSILALAFDHSPVAMCVSRGGQVVACNRELVRLLGSAANEVVPASAPCRPEERVLQGRDGRPFWCRISARPLERADAVPWVVWTFLDLSASRRVIPELTSREQQIARGLLAGGTSKDIALQVGISPRTVEGYRCRLMRKLDAANQRQLVARLAALMQPSAAPASGRGFQPVPEMLLHACDRRGWLPAGQRLHDRPVLGQ